MSDKKPTLHSHLKDTVIDLIGDRVKAEYDEREKIAKDRSQVIAERKAVDLILAQDIESLPTIITAAAHIMKLLQEHYEVQVTGLAKLREAGEWLDEIEAHELANRAKAANSATLTINQQIFYRDPETLANILAGVADGVLSMALVRRLELLEEALRIAKQTEDDSGEDS